MSFYLSGRPGESCRLKSFSSRSQGGKMTISIVVEVAVLTDAGYVLEGLCAVEKAQEEAKKAAARKPKLLMLPAPETGDR